MEEFEKEEISSDDQNNKLEKKKLNKEGFLIIRKLAYYLILIISATLFFYFMITSSLYFYQGYEDSYSSTRLIKNLFIPLCLAIVSLLMSLVVQFVLIKKPDGNEKMLYSYGLILFGVIFLFVIIFTLFYGISYLVTIEGSIIEYLVIFLIPVAMYSLFELIFGVMLLKQYKKENTKNKK